MFLTRHVIFLILPILLIISGCASMPRHFAPAAELKIEKDVLYFNGAMQPRIILEAIRLSEKSKTPITTLRINSRGGDVEAGIEFGYFVYKKGLGVIVEESCFSSCANYIITAGRNTLVKSGAVVGWHGGAHQKDALWYQFSWYEHLIPGKVENAKKYWGGMLEHLRVKETEFFKTIGVDKQITTYGQTADKSCRKNKMTTGWFYKLSDLKSMGVDDIHLEDGKFNEKNQKTNATACEMPKLFDA
ncbi:MAG: hypothetical protein ISR69_07620 [Gammaproteobacteria bacterium]|nr:hypothetical protein [Gammaproteobacteria bacterium]